MPVSSIWGTDSYLGATYRHGRIMWSETTGANVILGAFDDAYRRSGGVKGHLRLPVADREKAATLPNDGRRQRFQRGRLYSNPGLKEVFYMWGPILTRYKKMGEASGKCGYPTSDLEKTDTSVKVTFAHGTITFEGGDVKVACS
jgi:uncharacterized protein with LGFP repeats